MLVLSRKKNESIVVNDAIVITVVEIRGDKVRLGIEAPRDVPIHRSEVYAAIQAHNQGLSADGIQGSSNGAAGTEARDSQETESTEAPGTDNSPCSAPR